MKKKKKKAETAPEEKTEKAENEVSKEEEKPKKTEEKTEAEDVKNASEGVIELQKDDSAGEIISEEITKVNAVPDYSKEKELKKIREKQEKLKRKEEKKQLKRKKYPQKLAFSIGFIVIVFAVIGVVLIIWNSVGYIMETSDSGSRYSQYNSYLTPVAAVDPDPFDDITKADGSQLLNVAIWSVLSADSTPDTYTYSEGYMLIPAADIEAAFVSIFGPEAKSSVTHQTVQGYNSTFIYDSVSSVYKIPVTTINPIYTPQVTNVEKSGSSLIITANYLSSESWAKDSEGNYITPAPDKVMKITLRELQGSYYIGAIQTVSSTVPETVSFEADVQETTQPVAEDQTEEQTGETTTVKKPEYTTLGGRV